MAALAAEPRAKVDGDLPPELKSAIAQAVGETDRPIQNRFEARRRARAAAEDAIAVLRSEGYYAYAVEPVVGEGDAPSATVQVTPGPRFAITDPHIDWIGVAPDATTAQAAKTALSLTDGQAGRAADIISAEGRAVAIIQKRGYADVRTEPRAVVVDHADDTVQPTFRISSGPVVRLNGIELVTTGRTNPAWLRKLAPWRSGDDYDPDKVGELERRLLDTSVFESVTVALAPGDHTTPDGLRPVVVSLAERKPRTLEAGASYSSTDGAGLDLRWTRYNIFRRADSTALFLRASDVDSRAGVDVSLPHWRRGQQTLKLGAQGYQTVTDAYDETGAGVSVDVERRYSKTSYVTVGASLDFSRTDELRIGTLTPLGRELVIAGLLADLALDRSNDPLDPRSGWRISARAEPTLIAGVGEVPVGARAVPYLQIQGQGSIYIPLGVEAKTVLAGKAHLGVILGGTTLASIPASRRFYAGGGGSVRGYGYQAGGPKLGDGTPPGGLSLSETSLEVRRDITRRWGVAAFVDGGAVGGKAIPSFKDLSFGAGLGVRYNMGFGPIRFDVAVPVPRRSGDAQLQIYVSIGQSF